MSVGMPETIKLDEFGLLIFYVFGDFPYHVGSSLEKKSGWRDVDVRLLVEDDKFKEWGFGDPTICHTNHKWLTLTKHFSDIGRQMTGLPIDFQIQQQSWANKSYPLKKCKDTKQKKNVRSALGITSLAATKRD